MADTDYEFDSDIDGETGKKQRPSQAGRKLVRWNPDIDQFLLLAVDLVCSERGTPVPWDFVAEKLNDYVTGEGIKQHLAKVRKYREQNDRRVPEKSFRIGGRKAAGQATGSEQGRAKKKAGSNRIAPATGKGASLLWSDPRARAPRQQREPVEDIIEASEQKPKSGRKKATSNETSFEAPIIPFKKSRQSAVKADDSNNKKSTGKRSRVKKNPVIKDEDEAEYTDTQSPMKRQRNLRTTDHVNYDESRVPDGFDEDVFDARNYDDGNDDDGEYEDVAHGSQPPTVMSSEASSRSSRHAATTQMQPPPNFDDMMHSRTGVHAYGEQFGGQDVHLGILANSSNDYAPTGYHADDGTRMNGSGMMVDYGSQFNGPPQHIPEQMQVHAQDVVYGGYGIDQQPYGGHDDGAPKRKAREQSNRHDQDVATTPLSKKTKKKDREPAKQSKKEKTTRKPQRKDSVQDFDFDFGREQHGVGASYNPDEFNEAFGGPGMVLPHKGSHGLPSNMNLLNTVQGGEEVPTFTASPTDIDHSFQSHGGLPIVPTADVNLINNGTLSTGITPQFNNFTFGDSTAKAKFMEHPISTTGFQPIADAGFGINFSFGAADTMGNYTSNHGSYSSSNGASVGSSRDSLTLPHMQFGAGGMEGAGLGLEHAWVPRASGMEAGMGMRGMGMDMISGQQDHDMFSFGDGFH